MEDPFYLVRDDVVKALSKTRGLFQRLGELDHSPAAAAERAWTENELRNALRSIEWDVEDLQETISIVEKNRRQFKLEEADLRARRSFVKATKDEVEAIRERLSMNRAADSDRTARQELAEADELPPAYNPLLDQPTSPDVTAPAAAPAPSIKPGVAPGGGSGYSRLRDEDEPDDVTNQLPHDGQRTAVVAGDAGVSNQATRQSTPGGAHTIMIDDVTHEVDVVQGRTESALTRARRLIRMPGDKRHLTAIGVLSGVMLVVLLMFVFV